MITATRRHGLTGLMLLLLAQSNAQTTTVTTQNSTGINRTKNFNQNASRSNNGRGLSLAFTPVYNSALNSSTDSLLFRGSGAGFRVGADYFFGKAGMSFATGFSSSAADDASINNFIQRSGIPPDALEISKARQQNMYLLLGPSVRFGNAVEIYAHAKGGLFINNGGLLVIQQKGAQRPFYKNESISKSIYPGFLTGISIQYKTKSEAWSFGIGADYMNTKTTVNNYDIRRGGGIDALKLSRNITDVVTGVTVRYNITSPRDAASGLATGRRRAGRAKFENIVMKRGTQNNGQEEEITVMVQKHAINTKGTAATNGRMMNTTTANCGPVTQRVTSPDGTTEELSFACPEDAAAYNERISRNVTVPKQTQGATFGEKVNQGLHAAGGVLAQGKNIISGKISWVTEASTGIVTNKTVSKLAGGAGGGAAQASYAATGMAVSNPNPGIGSVLTLYAREAGSGQASGRRDKGSGMATGRRQYQPIYQEGSGNGCDTCSFTVKLSSVNTNPYFAGNEMAGENVEMINGHNNPVFQENKQEGTMAKSSSSLPDQDCDGLAGVAIFLKDPQSGAVVARTSTSTCGDFFFANVPDGEYVVAMTGTFFTKKSYDYYKASSIDVMGVVETGSSSLQLKMDMLPGNTDLDAASAAALIKTKTKSNQSNDRKAAAAGEEETWSPLSNIKMIPVTVADVNGDGTAELIGGTLPGGSVISAAVSRRPGTPIGGIIVKGGKNPGGVLRSTTTNEDGTFEFTNLDAGAYSFTVEQTLIINDETYIQVGESSEEMTARKGWDGTVKGGSKAQDHNSTRSNKTASSVAPNPDGGGSNTKAQDHNSTRSNKTASSVAPNPDGGGSNTKAQDHNSTRSNKTASSVAPNPDGGGSNTKAQDHNSTRSNKTVSSVAPNPDGGGSNTKAQDHNSTRSNKTASSVAPNPSGGTTGKLYGSLKTILVMADMDGDGEYETDVTSNVNDEIQLSDDGSGNIAEQKAGISTSRSNLRSRNSVQSQGDKIYMGYGTAEINKKNVPVKMVYKVVEKATSGLKDTLKTQV
jgi:hypothetical protein